MVNQFRESYKAEKKQNSQVKNLPDIYYEYFGDISHGTFVEIGAFNCYNWSNTFMLVGLGWNGLYVEPNPEYFTKCHEMYDNHPRIQLAQLAVGDFNGETELFLGGSLTTIKEESVAAYNEIRWGKSSRLSLDRFIMCEVRTLDTLLEDYGIQPGFEVLSIDVEGAEIDVMKGFSLEKWKPQIVIIEAHEQCEEESLSWKGEELDGFFHNYKKIYSDHINNVYVK